MGTPFAFRMRAYAAAHFAFDSLLEITWPDAAAILQSEYTGGDDGRAYAVTLFGEIRGDAESLDAAQSWLAAAIGNALPSVALAANAAIDDPIAIAVLGLDLSEPREFMWYAGARAVDWFPPGNRMIAPEATLALMTAVGNHPQTDLLQRAIESYRRALINWVPERLLMAGEFLFIAAEALSRCLIETRSGEKGITPQNLARLAAESGPDQLRHRYLVEEIFAGDHSAFDAMHAASNGFEHGYMAVTDVRGLMDQVLQRSMTAVRRALVVASGVSDEALQVLLSEEYAEPRGLVPALHVVRGELAMKDATKPPPDVGSLELDFPRPEPLARRTKEGKVEVDLPATLTALQLPDNVEPRPKDRPTCRSSQTNRPSAGRAGGPRFMPCLTDGRQTGETSASDDQRSWADPRSRLPHGPAGGSRRRSSRRRRVRPSSLAIAREGFGRDACIDTGPGRWTRSSKQRSGFLRSTANRPGVPGRRQACRACRRDSRPSQEVGSACEVMRLMAQRLELRDVLGILVGGCGRALYWSGRLRNDSWCRESGSLEQLREATDLTRSRGRRQFREHRAPHRLKREKPDRASIGGSTRSSHRAPTRSSRRAVG